MIYRALQIRLKNLRDLEGYKLEVPLNAKKAVLEAELDRVMALVDEEPDSEFKELNDNVDKFQQDIQDYGQMVEEYNKDVAEYNEEYNNQPLIRYSVYGFDKARREYHYDFSSTSLDVVRTNLKTKDRYWLEGVRYDIRKEQSYPDADRWVCIQHIE